MTIGLDLKDRKILYELDINARLSNVKIAKKVGLSKDAVAYRIKKLEELNIIRGYRAIIDSSKLGYLFYRVLINLIDIQPERLKQLIDFLKKQKNVWWITRLDGSWNFVFAIWVKSNLEFNQFYFKLNSKFKKNIKKQLVTPIVSYKNLNKRYLIETAKETNITSMGDRKNKK